MSLPREVVPGRVYMVTRRCTQRTYLLRPDRATTNAFTYCLAVAAQRTEVEVLFFLAMSNHYHAGILDRAGRLPEFLEHFHKLLAKHQNALRGRWENMWASEQTSAVELVGSEDVLAKMVYALTNPVEAHLVERADQWPGASSLASNLDGRLIRAVRPWRFFRKDGPLPERVTLKMHRPPGHEHVSQEQFAETLSGAIAALESKVAERRVKKGIRVLGRKAVLRQHWYDRPSTPEPRRRLDPRVACRNAWRRVETLRRNKAWLQAYRAARLLWQAGLDAVFPAGTWWLRRFAAVPCDPIDHPV